MFPVFTPAVTSGINAMRGGGQPLTQATRSFMEPRFGHNFNQVRIHTDNNAARISRQINARAFTYGQNIAFGTGYYQPNTSSGRRLLAHELTHVIQQRSYIQRQAQQPVAAPAFQIIHGANFHQILEGVNLNTTLLANVTALANHLINNNLVTGNITFNQGVRSPATAHRWSTAWSIRNNRVPLANLQALANGRDLDGNLWYQAGWTNAQIIANATNIWAGALAAEGYAANNPRRAPNTYPNVSRHCSGDAMDVTIPWAAGAAANALVAQFNLARPVAGEPWHFELL